MGNKWALRGWQPKITIFNYIIESLLKLLSYRCIFIDYVVAILNQTPIIRVTINPDTDGEDC